MLRIHIRLDLEDETGEERRFRRHRIAARRGPRQRCGGEIQKAVEERFDTEIGERAAEEDRRQRASAEAGQIELRAGTEQQRELIEELAMGLNPNRAPQRRVVEAAYLHGRLVRGGGPALEVQQLPALAVIHAL